VTKQQVILKMKLNEILPSALVVGVAIIGVSIVAQVLGQIKTSQTVSSAEYNITSKGLTALLQWGDWFSVIVIVVVAVIVIGLVMMLAGGRE
jgi:type II secretory pathway component PulF